MFFGSLFLLELLYKRSVVYLVASFVSVLHQGQVVELEACELGDPHEIFDVHLARLLFVDHLYQVRHLLQLELVFNGRRPRGLHRLQNQFAAVSQLSAVDYDLA